MTAPRDRAVRTYLATGRVVEIGAPFGDIDIRREIAEPLARNNRYHGQCADADGNPLSVAEHCVHGADALRRELANHQPRSVANLAAYLFLIHDAHEAITADPPRNFVAMLALKFSGVAKHRELIHDAIDEVKTEIDAELALVSPPGCDPWFFGLVDRMDRRMAAAEIGFAFGGAAERNGRYPPPVDVGIENMQLPDIGLTAARGFPADWRFWGWQRASAEWLDRFDRLRAERGAL